MSDLIKSLRESRKNPNVLKLTLISIKSARPNCLIFVFEGAEDIGVYESWLSRTTSKPTYEPVHGNGKEQLLSLLETLTNN
jgi:hypothetical protein